MTGDQLQNARRQEALVSASLQAAHELGLEIELDVETRTSDGRVIVWPIRINGFGRLNGTVIYLSETGSNIRRMAEAAEASGMFSSFLGPAYETYDPELFKSTLDDWGWHGAGPAPHWYTGAPWGSGGTSPD
jgi:hypothetical protein